MEEASGGGIMVGASWRRHHGGDIMEEASGGGHLKEESSRRHHGGSLRRSSLGSPGKSLEALWQLGWLWEAQGQSGPKACLYHFKN